MSENDQSLVSEHHYEICEDPLLVQISEKGQKLASKHHLERRITLLPSLMISENDQGLALEHHFEIFEDKFFSGHLKMAKLHLNVQTYENSQILPPEFYFKMSNDNYFCPDI